MMPVTPIGFMWLAFCASLGLLVGNVWLVLTIGTFVALMVGAAEAGRAQKQQAIERERIVKALEDRGDGSGIPTLPDPTQ